MYLIKVRADSTHMETGTVWMNKDKPLALVSLYGDLSMMERQLQIDTPTLYRYPMQYAHREM